MPIKVPIAQLEVGNVAVTALPDVRIYPLPATNEMLVPLLAAQRRGVAATCQEGGAPLFAVNTYPAVELLAKRDGTPLLLVIKTPLSTTVKEVIVAVPAPTKIALLVSPVSSIVRVLVLGLPTVVMLPVPTTSILLEVGGTAPPLLPVSVDTTVVPPP